MGSGSVWVSMGYCIQKCWSRNITVAGDAMHPMTPDLGQNEFLTPEDAVAWGQQFGKLITHSQGLVPG
ncbi:hypothetical protein M0R45_005494 [Rubus argutus]|uniref:FAD-binding domain-containing protein n=1 Tax=Rubus argutus TaxID=59490 RepID=A0AAW1YN96_RUBAR